MCVYMYICMYCEFSYYKGNAIYSSMFRYFLYHYIYICTFATSSLVLAAFFFFWLLFLYHISFLLHDLVFLTYE